MTWTGWRVTIPPLMKLVEMMDVSAMRAASPVVAAGDGAGGERVPSAC